MPPKKSNKKRTQVPIHFKEEEEERDRKRRDFEEEIQKMQVGVDDDPGISIYWSDEAAVHACLALPESLVHPQGVNPSASAQAIKNWITNIVLGIAPDAHVNNAAYFQHISTSEFGRIINALNNPQTRLWGAALHILRRTAGEMLLITKGTGKNEATRLTLTPFV
jgi:hypothetical protein